MAQERTRGGGQSDICQDFDLLVANAASSHKVKIEFEIKGRPVPAEKVNSSKCGNVGQNGCYVMPLGDGTAGSRCNLYEPGFVGPSPNGNAEQDVADGITGGIVGIDNLDYSCNWNKLTFGSSLTDRVAVPLYYDAAGMGEVERLVNPFNASTPMADRATKFVLRMRTPCLPCGLVGPNNVLPSGTRRCLPGADETVCSDDPSDHERYELNVDDGDDMVVQWQLDGNCLVGGREQACGLVGYPDKDLIHKSGLYESIIKDAMNQANSVVLALDRPGQVTHLNGGIHSQILDILPSFLEPVFTLSLNHALTSTTGSNIPYLEYQILTNKPIGSSSTKLEANVTVGASSYTSTIYKEQSKPLIDFAILN